MYPRGAHCVNRVYQRNLFYPRRPPQLLCPTESVCFLEVCLGYVFCYATVGHPNACGLFAISIDHPSFMLYGVAYVLPTPLRPPKKEK